MKWNMDIEVESLTDRELRKSFITTKELAYGWKVAVLTLERDAEKELVPDFSRKGAFL